MDAILALIGRIVAFFAGSQVAWALADRGAVHRWLGDLAGTGAHGEDQPT